MASLLQDKFSGNELRISQSTDRLSAKVLAGCDHLLLILPARPSAALWRAIPEGAKIKALLRRGKAKGIPAVSTRLKNKRQTAVHVARLPNDEDAFKRLTKARRLLSATKGEKSGTVGVSVLGFAPDVAEQLLLDVVSAAQALAFPMPSFKSQAAKPAIKALRLLALERKLDLDRIKAEALGNNLARWLTALPANVLDAPTYIALLKELAKENGWQFRKYGSRELEKMGAGAFLAVAQGNADDSAAIVRLRYRPEGAQQAPLLSLVGKGIVFDTGGNNLKPFTSMLDMHIDMGGSAVAVGTLLSLTRLETARPIDCWLAITENRIGPSAYKSQDVVTAANGKTIQTIHTDAEGRMALADTLVFAEKESPALILDYATLTGACITAITSRYCGIFSNRAELHPLLKRCGQRCGERVWPFPLGEEFMEELDSDTADFKQCAPSGSGDHILAASFLSQFVEQKTPWVHLDLSASMRKGGLAHVPSEITGFGVRYSLSLLLDHDPVDYLGARQR